jgi:hypothetical protein
VRRSCRQEGARGERRAKERSSPSSTIRDKTKTGSGPYNWPYIHVSWRKETVTLLSRLKDQAEIHAVFGSGQDTCTHSPPSITSRTAEIRIQQKKCNGSSLLHPSKQDCPIISTTIHPHSIARPRKERSATVLSTPER